MEINNNGNRYKNYCLWENIKNQPYDYEKNGLIKYLLPQKITSTNNSILQFILKYYEANITFMLKYIDHLKNFKNIHWKNR